LLVLWRFKIATLISPKDSEIRMGQPPRGKFF
jgi:hypothetical protein